MSKINITIDTEAKTMVADIDGEPVENLYGVSASVYNGGYSCQLTSVEQVGDLSKTTYLSAYGSEKTVAEVNSGRAVASTKFPGFIVSSDKSPFEKYVGQLLKRCTN